VIDETANTWHCIPHCMQETSCTIHKYKIFGSFACNAMYFEYGIINRVQANIKLAQIVKNECMNEI